MGLPHCDIRYVNSSYKLTVTSIFFLLFHRQDVNGSLTYVLDKRFRENISTRSIAAYAQYMNTHLCPHKIRFLDDDERVTFMSNGHLHVDNGTKLKVYAQVSISATFYRASHGFRLTFRDGYF